MKPSEDATVTRCREAQAHTFLEIRAIKFAWSYDAPPDYWRKVAEYYPTLVLC